MPRRVANGVDFNRVNMILAVLEKKCNINLGEKDIYVNVIGGIKIDEPAADLAIAMAIISSYKNIVNDLKTVFIGELGLTGEIRSVTNFEKRVREVSKLGYNRIYGNKRQVELLKKEISDLKVELIGINTIDQAISYTFK